MAKYIATAVGFDNVAIRNPGDVFDAPADFPAGDWFKPYKGKGRAEPAPSEDAAAPTDGGDPAA